MARGLEPGTVSRTLPEIADDVEAYCTTEIKTPNLWAALLAEALGVSGGHERLAGNILAVARILRAWEQNR